jgi:hypothetical protein
MLLREADPERAVTHRPLAPAISNVAQKRADQWGNLFTEVESTRRQSGNREPSRPAAPAKVPTSGIAVHSAHAATRPPLPVYPSTYEGAELYNTAYEEARLRSASPPPPPPPQPLLEPVRVGRTAAAPLLPPPRGPTTVSVSTARHQRYDQPEDEYGAPAVSSQPLHTATHRRHRYELQDYEEGEAQQDELVDSYEEVDASQESLLSGEYSMRSSGGSHSSSAGCSAGSGEGSADQDRDYEDGDEAGAGGDNCLHNESVDYSHGDEEQFGDYPVGADSYQLYEHDGYGHSGDQGREWAKTVAQQGVDLNDSFALIQLCYNSGL